MSRLQDVFLAKHFLGLFVLAVGAEDFASHGLGALFLSAAGRRIHAQKLALLIVVFFRRANTHAYKKKTNGQSSDFHVRWLSPLQ
jgi:hypothetical protein